MKKEVKSKGFVILLIIFSALIMMFSNSMIMDLVPIIFLSIGAAAIVKYDLTHPYTWFSIVFTLYSIAYPIVLYYGESFDVYTYTKSLMLTQWSFLATIIIIIGPKRIKYDSLKISKDFNIPAKSYIVILVLIVILTIGEILLGGYTSKRYIYEHGSILIQVGFRSALILLLVYAINLTNHSIAHEEFDYKRLLLVGSTIGFLVFFSGERDLLLRFLVISVIIYYAIFMRNKYNNKIIIAGIVTLFMIPLLNMFKYFGLTREIRTTDSNFIVYFMKSEFQSASKNLQIILLDDYSNALFKGETFITSFVSLFNLDKFFEIQRTSPIKWYNEKYFNDNRSGQGFSLVAEGYINFGFVGIFLMAIIIGIMIKVLYRLSNRGVYYFVYYIMSIPVFMYAIRSDILNIISPLIKQNLLIIIFLILITSFFRKLNIIKEKI